MSDSALFTDRSVVSSSYGVKVVVPLILTTRTTQALKMHDIQPHWFTQHGKQAEMCQIRSLSKTGVTITHTFTP